MIGLIAVAASTAAAAASPSPPNWQAAYQGARAAISNCHAKADQATCEPAIVAVANAQNQARASGDTKADGFLEIQIAGMVRRWSSGELDRGNKQLALGVAGKGFQSLQAAIERQGNAALLLHTSDLVGQLSLALHANDDTAQGDAAMGFLRKFGEQFWSTGSQATAPEHKQRLCAAVERYQRTEAKIGEKLVDGPSAAEAFRQAALWAERSSTTCPDEPELPPARLYQATYLFKHAQALESPTSAEARTVYQKVRELTCEVKSPTYKAGWGALCADATLWLAGSTPNKGGDSSWLKLPDKPAPLPPIDFEMWRAIDAGIARQKSGK